MILKGLEEDIESSKNFGSLQEESHYLDNRKKRAELATIHQNLQERKRYAENIFILICIWLAVVLSIVILVGAGCIKLDDSVLITLISTTTANVTAFFVLVVKYLFNPKELP
jgi:hypothetical protein